MTSRSHSGVPQEVRPVVPSTAGSPRHSLRGSSVGTSLTTFRSSRDASTTLTTLVGPVDNKRFLSQRGGIVRRWLAQPFDERSARRSYPKQFRDFGFRVVRASQGLGKFPLTQSTIVFVELRTQLFLTVVPHTTPKAVEALFTEENLNVSPPFVATPRTGTSCAFRKFGTVTFVPTIGTSMLWKYGRGDGETNSLNCSRFNSWSVTVSRSCCISRSEQ